MSTPLRDGETPFIPLDVASIRLQSMVDSAMIDYYDGVLPPALPNVVSGWQMMLPSGLNVWRSDLEECANPLFALGPNAIPFLLRWVMVDNLAIRYIAIVCVERITGIKYGSSYFAVDESGKLRIAACQRWKQWFVNNNSGNTCSK